MTVAAKSKVLTVCNEEIQKDIDYLREIMFDCQRAIRNKKQGELMKQADKDMKSLEIKTHDQLKAINFIQNSILAVEPASGNHSTLPF